jgi:hypothetical protein
MREMLKPPLNLLRSALGTNGIAERLAAVESKLDKLGTRDEKNASAGSSQMMRTSTALAPDINHHMMAAYQKDMDSLWKRITVLEHQLKESVGVPPRGKYLPSPPFTQVSKPGVFMPYSTCSAADFLHPRFLEIAKMIKIGFVWHRKLWEWVFIIHHLIESGLLREGNRGLVFGVGSEKLPALFAGMGAEIVATDAPAEIGEEKGWKRTGQHSSGLSQIRYTDLVDGNVFDLKVSYRTCDMNNIAPDLTGFDFNWSSCCFEHLGNLEAGMQFVVDATEKTLRVGGLAVHTTEFNLSSNNETLEQGDTVIYRRRDMEELVQCLRDRGHIVQPLVVAPDCHYWDFHIDVPPYTETPHLKLMLDRFVATSVGLVVRRGQ